MDIVVGPNGMGRIGMEPNKCIVTHIYGYNVVTIACSADVEHLVGFEFNVRISYEGTTTG